jgi:hypothetical protein
METETEVAVFDPIQADFALPLREIFHPLGFSVEIFTNSRDVLTAARESWGHFREMFDEPPATLHVGVLGEGAGVCPPPPRCRARKNLMVRIADTDNYAVSDMARGFSFAWLTPALVANRPYLRYHFLEAMMWDLLDALYFTSLHAACVSKHGRGILLCGDSGAGKSTLSFACARQGWQFLSDDSTCLVRGRKGRIVVGNPYQIRFRESATEIFPELKERQLTLRVTGEMALELPTASLPGIRTASQVSVDYIVFLNRQSSGPARLLPFSKEVALEKFERIICYGELAVREAQKAALRDLFLVDVLELRYGNFDSALEQLNGLVGGDAPTSAPTGDAGPNA